MERPDDADLDLIWRHVSGGREPGDEEALARLLARHPGRAADLFALAEERLALERILREPGPVRVARRRSSPPSARYGPRVAVAAAALLLAALLAWYRGAAPGRGSGSGRPPGDLPVAVEDASSPAADPMGAAAEPYPRPVTLAPHQVSPRAAREEAHAAEGLVQHVRSEIPAPAAAARDLELSQPAPSDQDAHVPASTDSTGARASRSPAFSTSPARAPTTDVVAVLAACQGDVFILSDGARTRARAGDRLLTGQGVETGDAPARVDVAFQDEMRVVLGASTRIQDRARSGETVRTLDVRYGMVQAEISPRVSGHPLLINTPQGEARILGTVLRLVVDPEPDGLLQLMVLTGKVRLARKSDGRWVDVHAGQYAEVHPGPDALRSRRVATVSFQDGVAPTARYEGTRDTTLAEYREGARRNFGAGSSVWADGDTADMNQPGLDKSALVRWDLSAVPRNAKVVWAEIDVSVVNDCGGRPFGIYAMRRAWDEMQATWLSPQAGAVWEKPGAQGETDRASFLLGALAPATTGPCGTFLTRAGLDAVQAWISNPATNHGLILADSENGDALGFKSREAAPPCERPRLTVSFIAR